MDLVWSTILLLILAANLAAAILIWKYQEQIQTANLPTREEVWKRIKSFRIQIVD